MDLDLNFNSEKENFEILNDTLREVVSTLESSFKLTREARSLINESIATLLKKYIQTNNLERCYYVKNITPDSNICFVHSFTSDKKEFQNISLSELPLDVKIGDVLIAENNSFKVDEKITNEAWNLKKRIIEASKNSRGIFEIEGKKYMVCDKSDEREEARMSLKDFDTNKEFWGIGISKELYDNIKYGSTVEYREGKYYIC